VWVLTRVGEAEIHFFLTIKASSFNMLPLKVFWVGGKCEARAHEASFSILLNVCQINVIFLS
jgi:hypothetical protein